MKKKSSFILEKKNTQYMKNKHISILTNVDKWFLPSFLQLGTKCGSWREVSV